MMTHIRIKLVLPYLPQPHSKASNYHQARIVKEQPHEGGALSGAAPREDQDYLPPPELPALQAQSLTRNESRLSLGAGPLAMGCAPLTFSDAAPVPCHLV